MKHLNEKDIDDKTWQRFEQYQIMNRFSSQNPIGTYSNTNRSYSTNPIPYPRTNYYRDYYTGNNYEDEDGILLDNEYDDFGDDIFQEEIVDQFDMPFRKYGIEKKRKYSLYCCCYEIFR